MKLAIIFNDKKLFGRLTKLFTGLSAYHVGWVDEEHNKFYDMHAIRRRRYWSDYEHDKRYVLVDFPEVTKKQLEHELDVCDQLYGIVDYVLFGLRPLFHLFGQSTRNAGGIICSEMVNIDAIIAGVNTPWPLDAPPPSPADWYRWALVSGRELEFIRMKPTDT